MLLLLEGKGRKPRGKRVRNEQIVHIFTYYRSDISLTEGTYTLLRPQNSIILAQIYLVSTLDGLVLLFHATNRGKNAPEITEIDLNKRFEQSLRRIKSDTMVLADRFPTLF